MFPLNHDDPRNPDGLVLTTALVMDEGWPILLVTHDEDDGDWQFVNGWGDTETTDRAMLVHVEHVVGLDPTVAAVADLPRGWRAWRESSEHEWTREPMSD